MRGLKVRSADTLPSWSAALLADVAPGGLREYIDAQDILAMPKTGGTFTGPVILANDALTAFGAVTLQQMTSAVNLAINNLIAGAPVTLDTLQEIATALNNDDSAVTNLLSLIGHKADLAGAVFTGPVVVPSNTTQGNAVVNLNDVQSLIAAIPSAPTLVFDSAVFTDAIVGSNRNVGFVTTGIVSGAYSKVTVDVYGRVTAGSSLTLADLPVIVPQQGFTFTGDPYTILAAINALDTTCQNLSSSINLVDNKDGAEENWVGNDVTTTFAFNTIDWMVVQSKPHRLFVFVDGLRQPPGQYTVGLSGLTFSVAPVSGTEIEAVFIA